ncbi:MAG: flagellar basal body L-ring protein FlgH [Pseudomonadota bacterium]
MKQFAIIALPLLVSCTAHLAETKPLHREYSSTFQASPEAPGPTDGSLFRESAPQANLFADSRARIPGDLVTVLIDEETLAERDAATELKREAQETASLRAFFGALGLLQANVPEVQLDPAVDGQSQGSFDGRGSTSRREAVRATIPCTVRQVLEGGNLLIEGERAILVNHDEQRLYISGVIRPQDITPGNTVLSTRVVDAHIEFTGSGTVADRQRDGWLSRVMSWVWPF